jgi:UDP-glucose 4-epimerase
MAHAYHDELRVPTVTVRPFNVYGQGRSAAAIRAFIEAASPARPDDPRRRPQIRAWCYVDDMVEAVLLARVRRPSARVSPSATPARR